MKKQQIVLNFMDKPTRIYQTQGKNTPEKTISTKTLDKTELYEKTNKNICNQMKNTQENPSLYEQTPEYTKLYKQTHQVILNL